MREIRKVAYTYNLTTAAASRPVSLIDVKTHLKLNLSDTSEDAYLNLLIDAAVEAGERYTNRDFINKSYTTFREVFVDPIELRKSKVSSITSISYLLSGTWTTLATTVYGLTDTTGYPLVYLKDGQDWPSNVDNTPQCIRIIFVSGYGTTPASVPSGIRMALLNHIAFMYENRGDCNDCNELPSVVAKMYNPYRIINIGSEDSACYFRGC
jgi:uncharacterized phiE125 gp8 family phage protein